MRGRGVGLAVVAVVVVVRCGGAMVVGRCAMRLRPVAWESGNGDGGFVWSRGQRVGRKGGVERHVGGRGGRTGV